MTSDAAMGFAPRDGEADIETGTVFRPRFDADGLIPAIVTDRSSGEVLMFAHMNRESLRASLATGVATFWSRSRGRLWKKGEESGNVLRIAEIRTDCDQDVIWLIVDVGGAGVACHTGARSCFYRRVRQRPGGDGSDGLEHIAPQRPQAAES